MRISVFGLGYVGAVSCGCLAALGHEVIGVDVAASKADLINAGMSPILEPGVAELIAWARAEKRLWATTDVATAVAASDAAFVCVGTPSSRTGGVLVTYLKNACREIAVALRERERRFTVFVRSTGLPWVHVNLQALLAADSGHTVGGERLGYVCHPEFLREGTAVADFHYPPKIIYGTEDDRSREVASRLYPGIAAPTFFVSTGAAAMVKYADNAFHAVKVAFANEIGVMCREYQVDARAVMDIFCQDTVLNISSKYLRPGSPFGGSCLPKDLRALLDAARDSAATLPMLNGALQSNEARITDLLTRVTTVPRRAVGIVGLAFKEGTDDVRESPAVAIVEQLLGKGHPVRIYDQHLSLQSLIGANRSFALQSIPHLAELLTQDLNTVISRSEVLIVCHRLDETHWSQLDWPKDQCIIDLVGVDLLKERPGYEGVYWSFTAGIKAFE